MLENIKREVISILTLVQIKEDSTLESIDNSIRKDDTMQVEYRHDQLDTNLDKQTDLGNESLGDEQKTFIREEPKVGRNQPCPCGSGKKYKQCHGAISSSLRGEEVE